MAKITVIVPVYNVEIYIRRCIESILNQTFKDFEIVLVDDGSNDQSGVLCDEYANSNENVNILHQNNQGLSAARNAGIEWAMNNSDSEWISFIDSDDYIDKRFLELLYDAVINKDTSISACDVRRTNKNFEIVEYDNVSFTRASCMDYYKDSVIWATIAPNKLYRKEIFENIRYPVGKQHEDEFVTYKILYAAEQITLIDIPLYFYFQRENSIMKMSYNLKRLDGLEAIRNQCEFFFNRNRDLYKFTCKRFVGYYVDNYNLIQQCENSRHYNKILKKKFGKFYRKCIKISKINYRKDIFLTELAFPIRTSILRRIYRIYKYFGNINK